MDLNNKSDVGFVRAMARELLVHGRVANVYDAIAIAEDLISETSLTSTQTKEKNYDMDKSQSN